MELLRVPSYQTLTTDVTVPQGYTNIEFTKVIKDMSDLSITEDTVTASEGDEISIELNGKFDTDYYFELIDDENNVVFAETYEVRRPYVNPTTLGTSATEIADATKNEELARAIIDSVIPQGFYYKKKTIETVGLGTDYIPLWDNAKKLLRLYENNVLVYDSENAENYPTQFEITKDKTAIVISRDDQVNRMESAALVMPSSQSDLLDLNFGYRGFPKSFDYRIVIETGYTSVPSDIVRATTLLIDDIACGKLDYYKRYIEQYDTDQYKIKFNKNVFEGTGNIIVDKILSKYAKSITKLGVL